MLNEVFFGHSTRWLCIHCPYQRRGKGNHSTAWTAKASTLCWRERHKVQSQICPTARLYAKPWMLILSRVQRTTVIWVLSDAPIIGNQSLLKDYIMNVVDVSQKKSPSLTKSTGQSQLNNPSPKVADTSWLLTALVSLQKIEAMNFHSPAWFDLELKEGH